VCVTVRPGRDVSLRCVKSKTECHELFSGAGGLSWNPVLRLLNYVQVALVSVKKAWPHVATRWLLQYMWCANNNIPSGAGAIGYLRWPSALARRQADSAKPCACLFSHQCVRSKTMLLYAFASIKRGSKRQIFFRLIQSKQLRSQPKTLRGNKYFVLKRATIFGSGTTSWSTERQDMLDIWGHGPFGPPGHAYGWKRSSSCCWQGEEHTRHELHAWTCVLSVRLRDAVWTLKRSVSKEKLHWGKVKLASFAGQVRQCYWTRPKVFAN